jgi:hypothetical protein
MPRDPYYIVRDVVNCAQNFMRDENALFDLLPGHGPYIIALHRIEGALARSARAFKQFHEEYKRDVAKLKPRPFTLSLRDAIDELPDMIEMRLRRWGWEYVLAADGMKQVSERLKAHNETKLYAVLDAAISRAQARKKFERHQGANDLANEADRLDIKPTLTPEEGDRLLWPRYNEWYASPALAETLPSVSIEEHSELIKAVNELGTLFNRLESPEQLGEYTELNRQVRESTNERSNVDQPPEVRSEGDGRTVVPTQVTEPRRRSGGRPADTDVREDRRIAEAWKTSQFKSLEDLAKTLGKAKHEVRKALDRHRHRAGKTKPRKSS